MDANCGCRFDAGVLTLCPTHAAASRRLAELVLQDVDLDTRCQHIGGAGMPAALVLTARSTGAARAQLHERTHLCQICAGLFVRFLQTVTGS